MTSFGGREERRGEERREEKRREEKEGSEVRAEISNLDLFVHKSKQF